MSQDYGQVARLWCAQEKLKRTFVAQANGRDRMSYKDFTTLLSYEHWAIAKRLKDGTILLNGDRAPSPTTAKQMSAARSAASRYRHALVPFAALSGAGLRPEDVEVVAMTTDKTIRKWVKVTEKRAKNTGWPKRQREDGEWEIEIQQHFLGETLFKVGKDYFVTGLDRNDDPRRRNFFLAKLPWGRPKTVDEALEMLRPKGIPENALRQGEWFLTPVEKINLNKGKVVKLHRRPWETSRVQPGVPLESDRAKDALNRVEKVKLVGKVIADSGEEALVAASSRQGRHVATRMFINGAVYVSGMLRDTEHGSLKLGDGKTWYKVTRNRSKGSWSSHGSVD